MNINTVLHVGLPKAASTTIQHNFLREIPETVYVSRADNAGDPRYFDLYEQISQAVLNGKNIAKARDAWRAFKEANQDSARFAFSDERFTLAGGRTSSLILDRPYFLRQIFGAAKVVFVLRSPYDYLRSYYQQHGIVMFNKNNHVPVSIAEWLDPDVELSKLTKGAVCQAVYYAEIAIRFAEFFGKRNIGVFFLEDLKNDGAGFFRALQQFLCIDGDLYRRAAGAQARNVTTQREAFVQLDQLVPGFARPEMPAAFLAQCDPVLKRQAKYLRHYFGIDVREKWPDLF